MTNTSRREVDEANEMLSIYRTPVYVRAIKFADPHAHAATYSTEVGATH